MQEVSGVVLFLEGQRYWFQSGPLFGISAGYYLLLMSKGAVEKVFYKANEEEVEFYRPEGFVFK